MRTKGGSDGEDVVVEGLNRTMERERGSRDRIRQLMAEVMRTADDMGTSPETLLFEINIVKVMAEEVLTMKAKEELFSSCHGLPSKRGLKEGRKGAKRLRKAILVESERTAQEMMERNSRPSGPKNGQELEGLSPTAYVNAPADLRFGYIN